VIGIAFVILGLWSLRRHRGHTHSEPKSKA
jgi:hypothetical protein